jgi:hypothetical protein
MCRAFARHAPSGAGSRARRRRGAPRCSSTGARLVTPPRKGSARRARAPGRGAPAETPGQEPGRASRGRWLDGLDGQGRVAGGASGARAPLAPPRQGSAPGSGDGSEKGDRLENSGGQVFVLCSRTPKHVGTLATPVSAAYPPAGDGSFCRALYVITPAVYFAPACQRPPARGDAAPRRERGGSREGSSKRGGSDPSFKARQNPAIDRADSRPYQAPIEKGPR